MAPPHLTAERRGGAMNDGVRWQAHQVLPAGFAIEPAQQIRAGETAIREQGDGSEVHQELIGMDVERCACGGQLKILPAIEAQVVIVGILTHLGLAARAPPRAAAREFSLDYAA